MSLKTILFGEPLIDEICKKILRNKKLNNDEKLDIILHKYIKYFNTKYVHDVNLATYEIYYEYFVSDNGKVKRDKYVELFNKTMGVYTLVHMENLYKFYSKLKSANIDKLDFTQKKLIENINKYEQLVDKFNHEIHLYYSHSKIKQALDKANDKILKDCTNGLVSINFFTKDETYEK